MSTARAQIPSGVGKAAWLFLAPALILIFVFFFLPVLASLVLSVTDFDIYSIANPETTRFVGLKNYGKLLRTPEFWQALRNNIAYAVVSVIIQVGFALVLAAVGTLIRALFMPNLVAKERDSAQLDAHFALARRSAPTSRRRDHCSFRKRSEQFRAVRCSSTPVGGG